MTVPRILIVEDERIVADDLKETLKSFGYNVVGSVVSGEDSITRARELKPDLIMMDISLAGEMDGIEAAGEIRKIHDIPIIFLTAFADEKILARARITEPYGYILKPFNERELKTVIEIALYKHNLDAKLRESEERYRIFVENFQGIAYRTRCDGTPIFLHGAVQPITGYPETEFINGPQSWEDIVHPKDRETFTRKTSRIASGAEEKGAFEYRIIRKDGEVRWLSELLQSVPGTKTGTLTGHNSVPAPLCILQGARYDITEKKDAELRLRLMNEELESRVRERTEHLRIANQKLGESNKRFYEFIREAAMRLKTPLEVIEENMAAIVDDVEQEGIIPAEVALQLKIQMKSVEQIRKNIIDLNKSITDHCAELSAATRKFLTE
ncbi:MAG: response regulator [Minisyncoccia bacterium]